MQNYFSRQLTLKAILTLNLRLLVNEEAHDFPEANKQTGRQVNNFSG